MAKAFDSLSHCFLEKVYKFFNFGPSIIKWLSLLGNERVACINLDNGNNTKFFRLGRGRPQGDNISPNTFNFAEQILIFKIELDPVIKKIPRINPAITNNVHSFFSQESNRETDKNESLADDNTTLTLLEEASLMKVKQILNDFGAFSGLLCNFDKSCVMPTSPPSPEDIQIIERTGFEITDNLTLLGMNIRPDLQNIDEIFEKIATKIVNIASFWERFKLSIPGRITVAKTFMVSQLNYLGCFLEPSEAILDRIQLILDNFVKKNINIAGSRIQKPPAYGGLGMFNLKKFLGAQKCAWIARAFRAPIDNWQYDLKRASPLHNIALIRPCDISADSNPILTNFVNHFRTFYGSFSKCFNNFREAYIFDNPAFCTDPDNNITITGNFFGREFFNTHSVRIRSLKFDSCFNNGIFKDVDEFAADGLPLPVAVWMRLRSCLLRTRNLLTTEDLNLSKSIEEFLAIKVKGSKRFRKFLDRAEFRTENIENIRSVITFYGLIDLPVPVRDSISTSISLWAHNFLANDLRDFSFKCRANYLPLNNRRAAYDPDADPACTFCRIRDPTTSTRESFGHLFFTCPVASGLIDSLLTTYFNLDGMNLLDKKKLVWSGELDDAANYQFILLFFWESFRFTLYRYKLRKRIPNHIMVANEVFFCIKTNLWNKPQLRQKIISCHVLANWPRALG
jgi:hypothetical protein